MKRTTEQKALILKLFDKYHVLSGKKITLLIPTIHKSTIYRNLHSFEKQGIIKKVLVKNSIAHYEKNTDDHQHFICNDCDSVKKIHINQETIVNRCKSVGEVKNITISIRGTCKDCC